MMLCLPPGHRRDSTNLAQKGRAIILELRPSSSVAGAVRYFKESLRTADYLASDAKEEPGYWWGAATHLLGLQPGQEIDEKDFINLLENKRPDGERLTPRTNKDRIPGYEARFDMSKSTSVMALYDPEILKLFKESVHETLSEMERHVRVRFDDNGEKREEYSGNMIAGLFYHQTSRPVDGVPDLQPHYHAYIMNASHDGDRFVAARLREAKHLYFQVFANNSLATKLIARGYELEKTKDGFEIAGVPKSLTEKFSRRSQQIAKYLEDHKDKLKEKGLSGRAAQEKAWEATREDKPKDPMSREELSEEWRSRATPEEKRALEKVVQQRKVAEPKQPSISAKEAVRYSIQHNFERSSVVEEKALLADAINYGLGQVNAEEVRRELNESELTFGTYKGRRKATLPELLDAEGDILRFAMEGRGEFNSLGGTGWKFHMPKDIRLNADQVRAVKAINTSGNQLMVLRGSAGTGKSTLLKTAIEQMEPGTKVFAFAPTTKARDILREDGFQAETLAMLLKNPKLQEEVRGSLLIVDEAGLVGTRDMLELTQLVRASGSRLLLVGDFHQHSSISAGAPLRLLAEQDVLPVMEVSKIIRQTKQAYRDVVSTVDRGDAAGGLKMLDDLGSVMEEKDEGKRYAALARDYVKYAKSDKKGVLTIAPTHVEKNQVTDAIRDALRKEPKKGNPKQTMLGKIEHEVKRLVPTFATKAERGNADFLKQHIGGTVKFYQNAKPGIVRGSRATIIGVDDQRNVWIQTNQGDKKRLPTETPGRYQLFETSTLNVAVGEKLRITDKGKTKQGGTVSNGSIVTVQGFTKNGDLKLDKNKTLPKDFGMLDYGYSSTSVSAQGRTVGTLLLAMAQKSYGAISRNQLLVSVSRAKHQTKVYTDSTERLSEAVERGDEELSATEFVKGMEQETAENPWAEQSEHRHRVVSLAAARARAAEQEQRRQAQQQERQHLREERSLAYERG